MLKMQRRQRLFGQYLSDQVMMCLRIGCGSKCITLWPLCRKLSFTLSYSFMRKRFNEGIRKTPCSNNKHSKLKSEIINDYACSLYLISFPELNPVDCELMGQNIGMAIFALCWRRKQNLRVKNKMIEELWRIGWK